MKSRVIISAILVFLVAVCFCGSAVAMSGSGTASNPYIVTSDADLKALGTNIGTYANKYIELGADITCLGDQTPIGNSSTPFTGHFDGKNHTITNLNVSGAGSQGLFGQCGSSFSIKNLKLVNGHVTATSSYCGMLIGYVYQASGAVVENIETDGCKVDSNSQYVGGIVGNGAYSSSGSVTYRNCYVHDGYVVSSSSNVGGIVGNGASSSISYAILYDNCRVVNEYVCSTNSQYVGGIAGFGASSSSNVTYSGCEVRDCVIKSPSTPVGGITSYGASSSSTVACTATYTGCGVYNTMVWSEYWNNPYMGGIVGYSSGYSGKVATVTITNPIVDGCTITASSANNAYIGGVYGGSNDTQYTTITIKNPTVRNCSIIGNGTAVGGVVASA